MDFIPKSRWPLAPIFEAISNSLEAIADRQSAGHWSEPGEVKLRLYFRGLLPEARALERIEVADNGSGFDDANYERFQTFLDRTKGFNNRGSGRVQFLHFAKKIDVASWFRKDGVVMQRHFVCNPQSFITTHNVAKADPTASIGTALSLSDFSLQPDGRTYYESLTLAELSNALKSHFLLRLHLARARNPEAAPTIQISFYKNGRVEDVRTLASGDVPEPLVGDIVVPYVKLRDMKAEALDWQLQPGHFETLHWAHFKLDANELPENGVMLCSKGIAVDRMRFEGLKKAETVGGHRFLTAIHGDALNRAENVSHTVDRFTFPSRAETERAIRSGGALLFDPDQDVLFLENIEDAIEKVLPSIYKDLLDRREAQRRDVQAIAAAHGISADIVEVTRIGITDNEAQITEKLFKQQAEALAKRSLKIKKLFEELQTLDPSGADYHAELEDRSNKLLELIPEQNKQELSRYVIRRQMVARVLSMIIGNELPAPERAKRRGRTDRNDKEGLIHDLLFKRKAVSTGGPNDLWVLNEEFVHFEGCSDVPVDQIVDANGEKILGAISADDLDTYGIKHKKRRRPDIFLFVDEGQCILIELKAPDVELTEHLGQLERYCNLIANFSRKPITRFHCYLIGETISAMDVAGRYQQNIHGDWVIRDPYKIFRYQNGRQNESLGEAHIEVIKLSSIHRRAARRNKSFADRLGIGDEVLKHADAGR